MRVSHKHKFIFFAVPRTGSTTVRAVLDPFSDLKSRHITEIDDDAPFYHHISPAEARVIFQQRGWDFESYYRFCFVRNPFDRATSLFHHRIKTQDVSTWQRFMTRQKVRFLRKRVFNMYVDQHIVQWGRLEAPVSEFVQSDDGTVLVDQIFPFEHLKKSLQTVFTHMDLPASRLSIPHKNQSDRSHYRQYYNEDSKTKVAEVYSEDIKEYGYSF